MTLVGEVVCLAHRLVTLGWCGVAVEVVGEGMVVDGEANLLAMEVAVGATGASGELGGEGCEPPADCGLDVC